MRTVVVRNDGEVFKGMCTCSEDMRNVTPRKGLKFDRPEVDPGGKLTGEVRPPKSSAITIQSQASTQRRGSLNHGRGSRFRYVPSLTPQRLEAQVVQVREL